MHQHPTPREIKAEIFDAILDHNKQCMEAGERERCFPTRAFSLIDEAVATANRKHRAAKIEALNGAY